MKVKDLLEIQSTIEKRKTPCDLHEEAEMLNRHYSKSKDRQINILDMDLIHLVRSYSKCLDMGKVSDDELKSQEILNDLAVIENRVTAIKHNFKK